MPSCTGTHEAHGEQHEVGLQARTRCPAIGLNLLVDAHAVQPLHAAVLADELLRQHREIALGAFLLARRGAQLQRPVRPGQQLVLLLGRPRHDLELRDRERALADRGADAVGAGVAAADDHDVLAAGEDRLRCRRRLRR